MIPLALRYTTAASILLLSAVATCGSDREDDKRCEEEGDPSRERFGTDCLCCHEEFGAAGSVDPRGPVVNRVTIVDGEGRKVIVTPNPHDNFFVRIPLVPPLDVTVEGVDGQRAGMTVVPNGSCNRCHSGVDLPLVRAPE